ncbi:peptidylprolyl isomerase [Sulfurimonas sp. C5]|uniref:peptidylprolyl isomerase n=1 Tax=Sulfurimonas sp. C5 TaxID=3036947 RepID=UPI0024569074|nr:peptidylprolyl isomerase [Sulfurimonas sp. C5]MDH4944207.1 peptidylprolyl isomerase [Sulfurimonas sp. C5]
MITWMQRHKKWLIITIWVSTIAFVGAGFVGWGQYSYGDKAGAVAKVGDVEISMGELQKSYSRLYQQYAQMFQGNFDEERAKQFGLQKQALQQLVQQALLVNLAQSYNLSISDQELYEQLQQDKNFYKNGVFDKEVYKQVLSQNRLSIAEYEQELRKELLIQKTISLLKVQPSKNESKILDTLLGISDKIEYKVLSPEEIVIDIKEDDLKAFWQTMQNKFMTDVSYDIKFIKQEAVTDTYDEATISKYYEENKTHFKDKEGKLLELAQAKDAVVTELNAAATKKAALRAFVDYKNGKLDANTPVGEATVSMRKNPFNSEVLQKLATTAMTKPFIKPIEVNGIYYSFELVNVNPATPKTFAEAKSLVIPFYLDQKKKEKILELANHSVETFKGETSKFLTIESTDKLDSLTDGENMEFLQKLFKSDKKRSFITLQSGKIVLYDILEQKLLEKSNNDQANVVARLKTGIFSEGLMKTLQSRYKTEIFIQGL